MATFPGAKLGSVSGLGKTTGIGYVNEKVQQLVTEGVASTAHFDEGSPLGNRQPISLNGIVLPGVRSRSFFEDFYNTIHVIPPVVELGAISGDTMSPLRIWNAYLYPVELEAISFVSQGGIGLDGPAVPLSLVPLQIVEYTVKASSEGPATINAQLLFDFDVKRVQVNVTGTRARLSPLLPNWANSVELEYQFKTDLFVSRSGKEQRRALRANPRKRLSYTSTPTHARLRAARAFFAGWHNNTIIVPEEPRQARLLTPATDTNTLTLRGAAPPWMTVGTTVVVSYRGRYETREIAAVAGNVVTLTGVIAGMWPVGTKVHPGLAVRLSDSINIRHQTSEAASVGVEFEIIPTSEQYPQTVAPQLFNGREVWMRAPNWIDPVTGTFESQREVIDYGYGKTAVFTPIPFGSLLQKMTYTGRNFTQAYELVEFFIRCKGQLGEFYMPTHVNDIPVFDTLPMGSQVFRVPGSDFARDYAGDTMRTALAVFMKSGDVHLRRVVGVAPIDDERGSDSAVSVDLSFPYDLTSGNVAKISWMPVWRMATDTFTMEWLTNEVAQCQLSVRMIEDLT